MARLPLFGTPATALILIGTMLLALAAPAGADAKKKTPRFTVTIAPVYIFSTNSDANAPPPPGYVGAGYTNDHPTVDEFRVDYGIDYLFAPKWHLFYNHTNFGYALGRVLTLPHAAGTPPTSFVSGSIVDYIDAVGVSTSPFKSFTAHLNYFNHQRSDVTGLCLNQKECPNAVTGTQQVNPLSINSHGYEVGFGYSFGPTFANGQLLNATFAADYFERPSNPPPGAWIDSLGGWIGSTFEYPYSLTLNVPLPDATVTPSITYLNLPVLYEDSAVPEAYRGIVWGVSKVISKNATLSYTNYNLKSCPCIERVPAPDNLRLTWGEIKLDLHDAF